MPLPQWMQTAGQNWQQGGGVGGLMQNPWFQMGQSIGRGGSPTQGYMQAQDLQGRNMQLQQLVAAREQQKKLQQLLDKIRKGGQAQQQVQGQPQPGAFSGVLNMPGSQLPPPGTQGPMAIPQTFGSQPGVQTLQGGQPPFTRTPSSQARQGNAGGQYRQMLEAYAQYGTPNEQMQALGLLMKPPAQRRIVKDKNSRQRYADTGEHVFSDVQDSYGFEGTGIEAQALNNYIRSLPEDQRQDAIINLSRQRLTRDRTLATPQGTYIERGYDLGQAAGSDPLAHATGGAMRSTFVPKPATEGEHTAQYVGRTMLNSGAQMDDFLANNPDFDPTDASGVVSRLPGGNFVSSGARQTYNGLVDDWAASLVFLRSGVTAREEEVMRERDKWPQPGTKPLAVKEKALQRAQAELEAFRKGYREGRVVPEGALEIISQLEGRVEQKRKELKDFRDKGETESPWEDY